jgi:hypothetical protein
MKKKLLIATIITSIILVGCGKPSKVTTIQQSNENPASTVENMEKDENSSSTVDTIEQNEQQSSAVNATQENKQTSSAAPAINSTVVKPQGNTTTNNVIDYSQYVKKTWIKKENTNNNLEEKVYFIISKVESGKITGKFNAISFAPINGNLLGLTSDFEGTINKDTAECQYKDSRGNRGNIKLIFKANNGMETAITPIDKSSNTFQPPKGTFEFEADNIKNIKNFSPIESQSFMVNLNSWGNVKFVSGKLTAGGRVSAVFYLTNRDGDILYQLNADLPYSVDVKAVSIEDVNKDGLKDIIIIVADNYNGSETKIATVYLQKTDGSFTNDPKLDQDINASGNNKDINTVKSYLSQKF